MKNQFDIGTPAGAVFSAQDGYKTLLILEDLLLEDVLIADKLNGKSLSIEHGTPLRLVMPAHPLQTKGFGERIWSGAALRFHE